MSKALSLFAVDPAGSLGDNAPLMLYTRYSEMIYFAAHIQDPANVSDLHNMRISAKRLRYTLEIFVPAYEENNSEYTEILGEIKSCQEQIGDIHDCDVRIEQIREYLNQTVVKKPEIRVGLSTLIDQETLTRKQLYDAFVSYWNNLSLGRSFERKFVQTVFAVRLSGGKVKTKGKNTPNKLKSETTERS